MVGTFLGRRGMKITHTGGCRQGTILFFGADTPLALCIVPDSAHPRHCMLLVDSQDPATIARLERP